MYEPFSLFHYFSRFLGFAQKSPDDDEGPLGDSCDSTYNYGFCIDPPCNEEDPLRNTNFNGLGSIVFFSYVMFSMQCKFLQMFVIHHVWK